jgi:fructosamine-3-kinase
MTDDPPDPGEDDDEPRPETTDAATRKGVQAQRRRKKNADDVAKDFWHAVFATPVGRREMWAILHGDMHAFNTNFAAGPVGFPDPNAAWYQRGQQDLGLLLYHRWLAFDPQAMLLMHAENDPRFAKPKLKRKEE